jgi:hypothetical protein
MILGVNLILFGGHPLDETFRGTAAVNVEIFGATECELTDCVILRGTCMRPSVGLSAGL